MIMKARLYHDTRKANRDCVDAWSIYFPYPKWLREQSGGRIFGGFIGCTPTDYGMIRCTYEYDEITPTHGRAYLGKRVDARTTPAPFQKLFRKLERAWNNAITKNTEEAWEAWNRA